MKIEKTVADLLREHAMALEKIAAICRDPSIIEKILKLRIDALERAAYYEEHGQAR